MKLEEFCSELRRRLDVEVERITLEEPEVLARTSQLIVAVENRLLELKRFVIDYPFLDVKEEIRFFKYIKPEFSGLLRYYKRLFKIQLFEVYNSRKAQLKFYRSQFRRLKTILEKDRAFYQYVLSKATHMDERYFTRSAELSNSFIVDDRFSTPHEVRLSKFYCIERLQQYLLSAIQKVERTTAVSGDSNLTWTGSKTDLIELIYALHTVGVFNKKGADVKLIATHFEAAFNVTLGNYYRVFQEIRQRKTGHVNFLNQLKNVLTERIREADS